MSYHKAIPMARGMGLIWKVRSFGHMAIPYNHWHNCYPLSNEGRDRHWDVAICPPCNQHLRPKGH
jgi:hypothetical protein